MSLNQTNTSTQCKTIQWSKIDNAFWPLVSSGQPPCLLRTIPNSLFECGLIGQQNDTCGAIRPPCVTKEPPTAEAS